MSVSLAIASSIHGSGKTVLAFLLAHRLSKILKKESSILICSACMADGDIRQIIGAEGEHPSMEDLVNIKISSYNIKIAINKLLYNSGDSGNVFFIDTVKATPLFVRENAASYQELLKHLKQNFDLVIIDTSSDSANPFTQCILENCDHVLNIGLQDMQLLEKKTIIATKTTTYIINRYEDIYPDKKELIRLLGTRNIFTLPYCSELQEMKNRQKLYQYAWMDSGYMKDVDKLASFLMETFGLPEKEIKKIKNKSFIQLLKKGGKQ